MKTLYEQLEDSKGPYVGFLVGSGVGLVLLAKGEGNLNGLEGGDGGDSVVVAVDFDDNVGLGGSNDVALDHANIYL